MEFFSFKKCVRSNVFFQNSTCFCEEKLFLWKETYTDVSKCHKIFTPHEQANIQLLAGKMLDGNEATESDLLTVAAFVTLLWNAQLLQVAELKSNFLGVIFRTKTSSNYFPLQAICENPPRRTPLRLLSHWKTSRNIFNFFQSVSIAWVQQVKVILQYVVAS